MQDSPNKNKPEEDIKFIIEEVLDMFNGFDVEGCNVELVSSVGSRFHARVLNAAKFLGIANA